MRYLERAEDSHPDGWSATGVLAGETGQEYDTGGTAGPLAGVELALQGLGLINGWLDAVRELPGDVVDHQTVQALLVGLGHVDSAALAALSGTVVTAEVTGCAVAAGHASPSAWVAQQLRMTGAAAARACRLAADLDELPAITDDLRAGRVSRNHAVTMAQALRQQQRDQEAAARARREAERRAAQQRREAAAAAQAAAQDAEEKRRLREQAEREEEARQAAVAAEEQRNAARAEQARRDREAALLNKARRGGSPEDVADEADRQRATDPDALTRSEAAQRAARSFRGWMDRETGMGRARLALPPSQFDRVRAAVDAMMTFDQPDCEPDERRTYEQRQADAFMDVIEQALRAGELPTSRGQKPHVTVTVSLDTLAGGQGTGRTQFGSTLSAEAATRIACDAALTRVVLNAASQVLDVGRETRVWSTAQYKAAEQTFGGCAFPVGDGKACRQAPSRCDLHHVRFWRHGGRTDRANGVLLCGRHHDAVHHDGWVMTYDHVGQTVSVSRRRSDGSTVVRVVRVGAQRSGPARPSREPDRLPL